MKGLFSQALSAEGAEGARAESKCCCMIQLIVNADTKFACKIIVTFSTLLHEGMKEYFKFLVY